MCACATKGSRAFPAAGRGRTIFRPRGRGSALRFDADNIHAQCPQCNLYESGNLIQYRRGLIARIGAARVEEMETAGYVPKKWTVAELQAVRDEYRAKAKEMES